jgi:hypothetical protein
MIYRVPSSLSYDLVLPLSLSASCLYVCRRSSFLTGAGGKGGGGGAKSYHSEKALDLDKSFNSQ